MAYELVPFGDMFSFHNGKAIKALESGKYPVYGSNGLIGYSDSFLYSDAIIIGRVGASGTVMYSDHAFWASDNTIVVDVNAEMNDVKYCYYMLKTLRLNSFAGGSAQPLLTQTTLRKLMCPRPSIKQQQLIAAYLSAYDSLIETNQRQIKLLEEAAQRLYREWFVDLRFPGHEDVPVVDGVPEGWKRETVGTLCTKIKDTVAPENIPTGTPYIGLEHIPRHDFCLSEWGDSSDVTSSKAKYAANDIIFGQIRPYFHKVGFALNDGVASTDSFIMTPRADIWGLFLLTVFSDAFVSYTYQTCKEGAKMPRADWNQMKKYPILVADNHTQALFEDRIGSLAGKVRSLALQDHLLSEARDRLLPKLMSGEITI